MKDDKKQAERLTELLKDAEDHPLIKQLFAERAAEVLAERTTAAAAIMAIRKEQAEVIPKLQADLDAKEEKFKKARAAMESAGAEYQQAKAALSSEGLSFSTAISTQEDILIKSADPAIDEAKGFFNEKLSWLRSPGRISHNMTGGERNLFADTVTLKSESNYPAVLTAIDYCRDAILFLDQLKLMPEFDIKIIEAMKKTVPSIEVYSESTAERPMEGSKGRSFASYFPSDDLVDYTVRKLKEAADKLLAPKPAKKR